MTSYSLDIEALFREAANLRDAGQPDQAIAKFEEILARDPPRRAAILGPMGHIYFTLRNFDKALECYMEVVSLSPNSELGSLGLFHTLWSMGRYNDAFSEGKRFLSRRASEEYMLMVKEMRDALLDSGLDIPPTITTDHTEGAE